MDIINGREVPPLVVTSDHVVSQAHNGSVHVKAGELRVFDTLNGSLRLQSGTKATISGTQNGSAHISDNSVLTVTGVLNGSTSVNEGGAVVVEAGAKLAGSLHNNGTVIVRGVFGGSKSGSGELRFEGDGYEKLPEVSADGTRTYRF